MRLSEQEVTAIKSAAREAFGESAIVRLFGSRVDDSRRGGDIDLHFELQGALPDYESRYFFEKLVDAIVDSRKVDTIFSIRGRAPTGFEQIAYRDGVIL